jgi:hypothetical protein
MKQEKDTSALDNMQKLQQDRASLQGLLSETLEEVMVNRSFTSLVQAVEQEKAEKKKRHEMIKRERECQRHVRELQDKFVDLRKQKEEEIQVRHAYQESHSANLQYTEK